MYIAKDKECVKCKRFFNCYGKPRGVKCLHYEEREEKQDIGYKGSYEIRKENDYEN